MFTLRKLTLVALVFGFIGVAGADTLDMEGTAPEQDMSRPTRGMTQARVESRYGIPSATKDAVGDPPISSWEYENFIVFFEYDRVIHAVTKR